MICKVLSCLRSCLVLGPSNPRWKWNEKPTHPFLLWPLGNSKAKLSTCLQYKDTPDGFSLSTSSLMSPLSLLLCFPGNLLGSKGVKRRQIHCQLVVYFAGVRGGHVYAQVMYDLSHEHACAAVHVELTLCVYICVCGQACHVQEGLPVAA